MKTAEFLSRVVPAQGNYLTIQWANPDYGHAIRSFKPSQPDQINSAVGLLHWTARKQYDAYFAVAALNIGEVATDRRGVQVIRARREQSNVHLIRTLVMDCDVKRDGDGKDPTKVFSDRRKAVEWMLAFCAATKFPRANLAVNSGYGLHLYWILEDAVTPTVWQPLAYALREAMLQHGWIGDTSPTVDSARMLRPPGTVNMKAGTPVPVSVILGFTAADHPNQQVADALAPWVGVQVKRTGTHGGASISSIGPRPAHLPPGNPKLNAAGRAGLESRYKFSEIAKKCAQVKTSLDNHGNGDIYQTWYLGHITLAVFTQDGKDFVHPISDGDPRYKPEETDAAVARAEVERDTKGFGAPSCATYNLHRPGVCTGCPHAGRIVSPIALGIEEDDLPSRYRRVIRYGQTRIERFHGNANDGEWLALIDGDVAAPQLDELSTGGHRVTFNYTLAGRTWPVYASDIEMANQLPVSYFARQGMAVDRHTAAHVGDFAIAWITQLRMQQATRDETPRPFGWNFGSDGTRVGAAVAGWLYRTDGREEPIAGGDPKVLALYKPVGDIKHWRTAAALFEGGRADMQALIATTFAAPLIGLCGDVRGMTMNFWSTESGIGKSTAIKIGHSVWGAVRSMQSMRDTPNAVMRSLSEPRFLIRYWDELRVRKDYIDDFVEMIFTIPQGKERARMQADTTLREVGEWETMLVFTSNRPHQDTLLARDDGTDSGLARLLEVEMAKDKVPFDPLAGQSIKLIETNYGHAGRIFIKHIAMHLPEVQRKLASTMKALSDGLTMQRDERFSVTAMACILVGASIARQLDLFAFDLKGVNQVLLTAFANQRMQRSSRTMLLDAGGFDLEEMISEFCYAQADYRLRTVRFAAPGSGRVDILGSPRNNVVRLQISESEGTVRIRRSSLMDWLHDHNRPSTTIVEQLVNKMGASHYRKAIGGGTPYGGGTGWVLDIPLTGRLAELLTGVVKEDTTVVKLSDRTSGD